MPAFVSVSLVAASRDVENVTIFSTRIGAPCLTSNAEHLLNVVLDLVQAAVDGSGCSPGRRGCAPPG